MTLKKRGLGRGLEVLLAQAPALGGLQPTADGEDADARALIEMIQKEHLALLQEAEDLKKLLDEFESIVRAELR